MKKPIKVAYLDYSHIFAGAERVLHAIISNLDRSMVEPILVFPYPMAHQQGYNDLDCEKYWLADDIKWWMGSERWRRPVRGSDLAARTIWGVKLNNLLSKLDVDILHVNLMRPDNYMLLLPTHLSGRKIIGHFRSQAKDWVPPARVQRLCNKVLCVSQYSRSSFLSKGDYCDSQVLYDSIDIGNFDTAIPKSAALERLGFDKDTFLISSVGQLSRHKGHDHAIMAFSRIAKKHPRTVLFIVGNGVALDELKELANSLPDISGQIRFSESQVSNISDVYRASSLVLSLTKVGEAFGLVPYESALHGIPFIAPEVGAVREFIKDGENGLLVDTNDIDAITDKIEWAIQHHDAAVNMIEATKTLINDRLTPKIMADNLMSVYKSLS